MSEDRAAYHAGPLATLHAERQQIEARLVEWRAEGRPALQRLVPIAQRDSGQSVVVRRFLLGLYNGTDFPFDLTELRRLDQAVFNDCLAVLRMDWQPSVEIHQYIPEHAELFKAWALETAGW